jgi:cbb3-type cytochrome oxidase cytochrome c subunit
MNEVFITKMIQAKRLEKEALKSVLPESMLPHFEVIESELKKMMKELAKDTAEKTVVAYAKASQIIKEASKEEPQMCEEDVTETKKDNANKTNMKKSRVSSITIE